MYYLLALIVFYIGSMLIFFSNSKRWITVTMFVLLGVSTVGLPLFLNPPQDPPRSPTNLGDKYRLVHSNEFLTDAQLTANLYKNIKDKYWQYRLEGGVLHRIKFRSHINRYVLSREALDEETGEWELKSPADNWKIESGVLNLKWIGLDVKFNNNYTEAICNRNGSTLKLKMMPLE